MCSVVGPTEVKIRDERLDRAVIEVVARPLVGLPGVKDKALERNIRETLEPLILSGLHPRTGIQIVVQTMKDDGCVSHVSDPVLSPRPASGECSILILSSSPVEVSRSCRPHSTLSSWPYWTLEYH